MTAMWATIIFCGGFVCGWIGFRLLLWWAERDAFRDFWGP